MQFVMTTQIRENYGAHNWDGVGECPQYWKNKGGDTFVVHNVTSANCGGLEARLTRMVCQENHYFYVFPIGSGFYLDSESPLKNVEEWELMYVKHFEMRGGEILALLREG